MTILGMDKMKELISIKQSNIGSQVIDCVSARDLFTGLSLNASQWSRWSTKNIVNNEFFLEDVDWISLDIESNEKRGVFAKDYLITLDFGKHLAMMAKTKKAHDYRNYFISCEKQLQKQKAHQFSIDWKESRVNGKFIRKTLTDAIKSLERLADKQGGEKSKPENRHYYETATKMIYKELFGDRTLKNVRDQLDALQLQFLSICEGACADEIAKLTELDIDYHDIYQECRKRVVATVDGLSKSKLASNSNIKLAWEGKK